MRGAIDRSFPLARREWVLVSGRIFSPRKGKTSVGRKRLRRESAAGWESDADWPFCYSFFSDQRAATNAARTFHGAHRTFDLSTLSVTHLMDRRDSIAPATPSCPVGPTEPSCDPVLPSRSGVHCHIADSILRTVFPLVPVNHGLEGHLSITALPCPSAYGRLTAHEPPSAMPVSTNATSHNT